MKETRKDVREMKGAEEGNGGEKNEGKIRGRK